MAADSATHQQVSRIRDSGIASKTASKTAINRLVVDHVEGSISRTRTQFRFTASTFDDFSQCGRADRLVCP